MSIILDIIKAILFGILQGITEWLPISGTGHLILMQSFLNLNLYEDAVQNAAFWNMYKTVIQLGSIFAVLFLCSRTLNPFRKGIKPAVKRGVIRLWIKILIASVPIGIAGILFSDRMGGIMSTPLIVALALIIYGILFLLLERRNKPPVVKKPGSISYMQAFETGLFQLLSLIPGTSRSASVILGTTALGFDRYTAVQFSLFTALPVMLGSGLLRLFGMDLPLAFHGIAILLIGMITAFAVSVMVIRFLLSYIRKHDFRIFGWYRIVLGAVILLFTAAGVLG